MPETTTPVLTAFSPALKEPDNKIDYSADRDEVIIRGAGGTERYALRKIEELYGPGHGFSAVDPRNEVYASLLMSIELEILLNYYRNPDLIDGIVDLVLDRLIANVAANFASPSLERNIQFALRVELTLRPYAKTEVKQALRIILKSVRLHSKQSGIRGYLEFIDRLLGPALDQP